MRTASDERLPQPRNCERCGYISSQPVCKACVLLEGLNRGLPRLGVSRTRGRDGQKAGLHEAVDRLWRPPSVALAEPRAGAEGAAEGTAAAAAAAASALPGGAGAQLPPVSAAAAPRAPVQIEYDW